MDYRFLLLLVLPATVVGKSYFTAAVFEHRERAEESDSPQEIIEKNLYFYEKAVEVAVRKGADIILFNEYGLFPHHDDRNMLRQFAEPVPDPRSFTNPCLDANKDQQKVLKHISCLARNNNIYLIANIGQIEQCDGSCDFTGIEGCEDKCPDDGIFLYNTDVVFDRHGTLIARYHKAHPYFENVNIDDEPDFVTFETEFGRFGLFTCFDSNWHEAVQLASDFNVNTIIFPTFWYDDIVPLNAIEWQQAWALANKVNLLAANTQTPGLGSLGSGIYSKHDGALVYTYEPDGESKLLTANVKINDSAEIPVNPSLTIIKEHEVIEKRETGNRFPQYSYEKLLGPPRDMYADYRCEKSQTENYTLVKIDKPKGKVQACNNGFCCSATYSAVTVDEDFYLAVFSGYNIAEGYYRWCEESCLLVRCDSFEGRPCVLQPSRSKTIFRSLKLEAEFKSENIYAAVSKNKFRLAPKHEWEYIKNGSKVTLNFKESTEDYFMKAALLGRCYQEDPLFVPWYRV